MQSKKFRYAALILALLMVLSFGLVMFAGCNEGEGEEKPGPGPSTGNEAAAAKLVTDESLKDKLFVLYDFEESNKDSMATLYGYDPYTGEPNERNGYYSSATAAQTAAISSLEDQVEGSTSATALNVASGITLNDALHGAFDGSNVTNGVSVSFWAYNYEMSTLISDEAGGTLAVDRYNIVTNGMSSMTWGTLYGRNTAGGDLNIYPSYVSGTTSVTVGRGAYTEESYAARRVLSNATDTLMREFDDSATDPYTGWNAIAGNIQDATDEETYNVVYNIAHNYYQNWRYVTVSIQTDGVYFYTNGRLAYYYSAAMIGTDWCSTTSPTADDLVWGPAGSSGGVDLYYRFINALNATELTDLSGGVYNVVTQLQHQFGMFGADACIYADDLILGYGLDADEACALYEDVSGEEYTAADLECTAGTSADDQARQNAIDAYLATWKAGQQTEENVSNARTAWEENLSYGDYSYDADTPANGTFDYVSAHQTNNGQAGRYLSIIDGESVLHYSGVILSGYDPALADQPTMEDSLDSYYMTPGATLYGTGNGGTAGAAGYIGMSGADNCWSSDTENSYGTTPGVTSSGWDWTLFNRAKYFGYVDMYATVDESDGTISVVFDYYWYYYMTMVGTEVTCPGVNGDTNSYDYTITAEDCLFGTLTYTFQLSALKGTEGTITGITFDPYVDHSTFYYNAEYVSNTGTAE